MKTYTRNIWQYNLADFYAFKQELAAAGWEHCLDRDINNVYKAWTDTSLHVARKCNLKKLITVYPCDKPFFTPEL